MTTVLLPTPPALPADPDTAQVRDAVHALGVLVARGPGERLPGLDAGRDPATRASVLAELAHLARFVGAAAAAVAEPTADVAHHTHALAAALERTAREQGTAAG